MSVYDEELLDCFAAMAVRESAPAYPTEEEELAYEEAKERALALFEKETSAKVWL